MCQYGYIPPAFSGSPWNLEWNVCMNGVLEMGTKCVKRGEMERKWVKLGENATSSMWKKHQNLPSNNNDAQSIAKHGFLVRPNAKMIAPRAHCMCTVLKSPP